MRLDDAEIDLLLSAVTTEAQRRGRLPKRQPQAQGKRAGWRTAVEEISHGLTKGKLNAVRAAVRKRLQQELHLEIPSSVMQTPDALQEYQAAEIEKWWPAIRQAKVTAE